jgi:hypothetical protein
MHAMQKNADFRHAQHSKKNAMLERTKILVEALLSEIVPNTRR